MPTTFAPLQEHLLLTGFFSLQEYLHWRSLMAPAEEKELLAAWKRCTTAAASDDGCACAEDIRIEAIPGHLQPLRNRFLQEPSILCGSGSAHADVALVKLDALVVYQRHVNLAWADELRQRWLALAGDAERFHFCLPTAAPGAPVLQSRLSHDTFVFTSPSQDLRVQKILPLTSAQIRDWTSPGTNVALVGAAIGFGSNCLQAIRWADRLILVNGTHRAFALHQAGETMAPCLILTADSEEELAAIAPALLESGSRLLSAARPPRLRDLFVPEVTERLLLPRRIRQVRVTISVEELDLPG